MYKTQLVRMKTVTYTRVKGKSETKSDWGVKLAKANVKLAEV